MFRRNRLRPDEICVAFHWAGISQDKHSTLSALLEIDGFVKIKGAKFEYLIHFSGTMQFSDHFKGAVYHHERFRVDTENNVF